MGMVISVRRKKAFLRGGAWRSSDPSLESALNRAMAEWILETGQPHLKSQNPEADVAEAMARRFGGRVVLRSTAPRQRVLDELLPKRQMKLAFGQS